MDSVGSQRLALYLKTKRITLETFARRVGTSKALVSYWRSGQKVPGLEYALKIQRKTGIPPSAWLRPPSPTLDLAADERKGRGVNRGPDGGSVSVSRSAAPRRVVRRAPRGPSQQSPKPSV